MNTTVRLPILLGAALLTAAVSAGPAQAAPASAGRPHHDRTTTVGYFPNQRDCIWAGRDGESQQRWDNPSCDQLTDDSMQSGLWRLQVENYSANGNGSDNNNGHHGGGMGNDNGDGHHGGGNDNGDDNGHGHRHGGGND